MKLLPLSQGKVAKVSDEDFERVSQFKWSATCNPNGQTGGAPKWYAMRKELVGKKRRTVYLHRFIMATPTGMVVDHHPDPDGLNCTRENMRNVTQKKNCETARDPSEIYL